MKYVEIVDDWGQTDVLDGKPLMAGETLQVLWKNGDITTQTVNIVVYCQDYSSHGSIDTIEDRHAYITVKHNNTEISVRLYGSGLLCQRV